MKSSKTHIGIVFVFAVIALLGACTAPTAPSPTTVESTTSLSSIPPTTLPSTVPVLRDANGVLLGTMVSDGEFYNPTLKRVVYYDLEIGRVQNAKSNGYTELQYQTPDCTGQAYVYAWDGLAYTQLHVVAGQRYFIVQDSAQPSVFVRRSYSDGVTCWSSTGTAPKWYPVTEVMLPFSSPIAMPTHFG